ncbi:MAG: BON domain-containing protein [Pseudomonadota bacterium]
MGPRIIVFGGLIFLFLLFTGCEPLAIGTAGVSGYNVTGDERSIGTIFDDSVISSTVKSRMISDDFVKARYIDVDVLNGVVYLIGVIESASQKRMAADIARGVEGVRKVENQLVVGKTSAGQILDDSILTSKIKTELLKTADIRSNNVDVDTVNGVVTLTGIVSSYNEKNKILYIVQKISNDRSIKDNLSVANN